MRPLDSQEQLDELKQELQQVRSYLECSYDAIVALDGQGYISYWNPAAEKMYGLPANQVIGRPFPALIPEESREEARRILERVRGGETIIDYKMPYGEKDEKNLTVFATISPVKQRTDFLTGAFITLRKPSELNSPNDALVQKYQQMEEQLRKSERELDDLSYSVSHDLRGPIREIVGLANILLKEARLPEEEHKLYVLRIIKAATVGNTLLQGILAYSRLSRQEPIFELVDFNTLLQKLLADMRPYETDENKAAFAISPLPTVVANAPEIRRLFQEIIGNALKFRGKQPLEVRIWAERKAAEWQFSIRDNGIGFDPNYAQGLFRLFQRLHPAEAYSGSGVGLAVCRRIAERHGGRIWAESEIGKGSTFHFTIPAERTFDSTRTGNAGARTDLYSCA